MTWCSNLATITFYFVLLGRFDDVTFLAGLPVSGEEIIYWSAALLMGVVLIIVVLGIRETNPHSELRGQRLSWRNIAGGILDRELRPVYLLVLAASFLNFLLGPRAAEQSALHRPVGLHETGNGRQRGRGRRDQHRRHRPVDRVCRPAQPGCAAYQTTICLLLAGKRGVLWLRQLRVARPITRPWWRSFSSGKRSRC